MNVWNYVILYLLKINVKKRCGLDLKGTGYRFCVMESGEKNRVV